MNYWHY